MTRVGFFINDIDFRWGGIGPYTHRVLNALANYKFRQPIDLVVIGWSTKPPPGLPFTYVPLAPTARPKTRWRKMHERTVEAWRVLCGKPRSDGHCAIAEFFNALDIDVLHIPYQTPPTFQLQRPFVVTMHDVQEIHLPHFFTAEERRNRADLYLRSLREAARVVVSYDHVKQDLIRYFNCQSDHIAIVPLPIHHCTLAPPNKVQAQKYEKKYGRYQPFFLYPAQTWQHKNHLRLIEAFEIASQESVRPLTLICTGQKNEHFDVIAARLHVSPVADRVVFTGIVEESELHWLNINCLGVVIPTLYEAGSFPLMEAMQLGAPVVCAKTTSLPETVGDASFLFDPYDVRDIARLMTRLAVDEEFRSSSIRNGRLRISQLQNDSVGRHYEHLWTNVAAKRSLLARASLRRSA